VGAVSQFNRAQTVDFSAAWKSLNRLAQTLVLSVLKFAVFMGVTRWFV